MKNLALTFIAITVVYSALFSQAMNWTLLNTGTTKNIRDISFVNRDTGFIVGDNGLFKITTNGGTTWTDMTIPATGQGVGNNNNIKAAQFYANGGIFGGVLFFDKFTAVNRNYNIFTDSWVEECGGAVFSPYDSICSINNMHQDGWVGALTAGGNCIEGGGTAGYYGGFCFSFDSVYSDTSFSGWMDVTDNINGDAIWVGEDGYIAYRSGFSYTYANSGNGYDYLSVDWSDTSTVYAVNNSTWWVLEKSTDNGVTWQVDSTLGPTFWYPIPAEIDFTDNDWGVMACEANINYGVIITKRGNNIDFFNADTPLTSTYVIDSTLAFAGGLGGVLYKYEQTGGMSINEPIEQINFNIFPNPQNATNDELNLFSEAEVNEVIIFDITGKQLFHQNIQQQGNVSVQTGIHQPGTYFVRVVTDNGMGTKKYIVN